MVGRGLHSDAAVAGGYPPLTASFVGKFFLAAAGVDSALWLPVISLAVSSVIGLFYISARYRGDAHPSAAGGRIFRRSSIFIDGGQPGLGGVGRAPCLAGSLSGFVDTDDSERGCQSLIRTLQLR